MAQSLFSWSEYVAKNREAKYQRIFRAFKSAFGLTAAEGTLAGSPPAADGRQRAASLGGEDEKLAKNRQDERCAVLCV